MFRVYIVEGVNSDDVVVELGKVFTEVRSDESGCTCDEDVGRGSWLHEWVLSLSECIESILQCSVIKSRELFSSIVSTCRRLSSGSRGRLSSDVVRLVSDSTCDSSFDYGSARVVEYDDGV